MLKSKVVIKTRSNSTIIIFNTFECLDLYMYSMRYLFSLFKNENIYMYTYSNDIKKYVLTFTQEDFK